MFGARKMEALKDIETTVEVAYQCQVCSGWHAACDLLFATHAKHALGGILKEFEHVIVHRPVKSANQDVNLSNSEIAVAEFTCPKCEAEPRTTCHTLANDPVCWTGIHGERLALATGRKVQGAQ